MLGKVLRWGQRGVGKGVEEGAKGVRLALVLGKGR